MLMVRARVDMSADPRVFEMVVEMVLKSVA
jgi:hypothetical protein